MEITLTKIHPFSLPKNPDAFKLRCETDNGEIIGVLGSVEEGMRNINLLKDLKTPVTIIVDERDLRTASALARKLHDITLQLSECSVVKIKPVKPPFQSNRNK